MFRKLKNIVRDGFKGLWRNRGTAFGSMMSIVAVLLILGILLVFVLSVNNFVEDSKKKLDEIAIFLLDDATAEEVEAIGETLREHTGTASVVYESKEEAMEKTKEEWGENADLLEGLSFNPYPASYKVRIQDLSQAEEIIASVEGAKGVEKVLYRQDTIDTITKVGFYVRYGGLFLMAVLSLISILIISNMIKITVASRSKEINIMKYVGATNSYIRGSFIVEGLLIGLFGSLIALAVIYFGYEFLFDKINHSLFNLIAVNLVTPTGIFKDLLIIYVTIGLGIGALGSFISVKRFLNV